MKSEQKRGKHGHYQTERRQLTVISTVGGILMSQHKCVLHLQQEGTNHTPNRRSLSFYIDMLCYIGQRYLVLSNEPKYFGILQSRPSQGCQFHCSLSEINRFVPQFRIFISYVPCYPKLSLFPSLTFVSNALIPLALLQKTLGGAQV